MRNRTIPKALLLGVSVVLAVLIIVSACQSPPVQGQMNYDSYNDTVIDGITGEVHSNVRMTSYGDYCIFYTREGERHIVSEYSLIDR